MTKTFPVFPIPRLQDRTGGQPTTGGIAPLHQIKALNARTFGATVLFNFVPKESMGSHPSQLKLLQLVHVENSTEARQEATVLLNFSSPNFVTGKHSNNVHGYE
uniref:Uncharacterized protein n=1 Tax=Oryza punctata TaxID=4537 RepID=A0A0E0L4T8_ORYPU